MVLITDIRRHSMSDTRAVEFHNSYDTGTEKVRIIQIATTHSPAAIFVEAPTWKASLLQQFPCMTHCVRASLAVLVGQL